MKYGIQFGDKHTVRDWKLFLKQYRETEPPEPKTLYEDIPGGNGSLDLTESQGPVSFSMRKFSGVFAVSDKIENWARRFSEILNAIHGKKMKIILDDDPSFFYMGRVSVNKWKSDQNAGTITIDALCEPYKLERFSSTEDWEWDPFDLENGVIREYNDMYVDGQLDVEIIGSPKPTVPAFITYGSVDGEAGMTVRFNGKDYHLPNGKARIPDILILDGVYTLRFFGSGFVSIDYRGGSL